MRLMIDRTAYDEALAPLRSKGIKATMAFLWANVFMVLPVGFALHSPETWTTLILALVNIIMPSWCYMRGRGDATARTVFGIALTLCPILFLFLFRGNPWQMDMHMYFFVCFSLMVLMCDPRPIIWSVLLTVVHHFAFLVLVPDWVFSGAGSVSRVLVHGLLVGCEAVILLVAIRLIGDLTMTSNEARLDADKARMSAEQSLAASVAAEARAEREYRERLAEVARKVESDIRHRMTAEEIDTSIGTLIGDLREVANQVAQQANHITGISKILVGEAGALRDSSENAVGSITATVRNAEDLAGSIRNVGGNAQSAHRVAQATATSIATLGPGIEKLAQEIEAARGILQMVSNIANRSNLLALNAGIEAARSGEAGLGFAVVAAEMKQMASATARAAEEISGRLQGIVNATATFRTQIDSTMAHVDDITSSSTAITRAVEQQQYATEEIARGVDAVRSKVAETDDCSRKFTDVAAENSAIADSAIDLAAQLIDHADKLNLKMEGLLAKLRAA
jgi:methyl-accepting chemotaxis protein